VLLVEKIARAAPQPPVTTETDSAPRASKPSAGRDRSEPLENVTVPRRALRTFRPPTPAHRYKAVPLLRHLVTAYRPSPHPMHKTAPPPHCTKPRPRQRHAPAPAFFASYTTTHLTTSCDLIVPMRAALRPFVTEPASGLPEPGVNRNVLAPLLGIEYGGAYPCPCEIRKPADAEEAPFVDARCPRLGTNFATANGAPE
jgi:hypothetical protein